MEIKRKKSDKVTAIEVEEIEIGSRRVNGNLRGWNRRAESRECISAHLSVSSPPVSFTKTPLSCVEIMRHGISLSASLQ